MENKFDDIYIEDYYNDIAVYGDTRKYKEDLKALGGQYRSKMSKGPGWKFNKDEESKVKKFIEKGEHIADVNTLPSKITLNRAEFEEIKKELKEIKDLLHILLEKDDIVVE